jgi:hypothetical protein
MNNKGRPLPLAQKHQHRGSKFTYERWHNPELNSVCWQLNTDGTHHLRLTLSLADTNFRANAANKLRQARNLHKQYVEYKRMEKL